MTASTITSVVAYGAIAVMALVVISAAVGGFLSVTKGEPPPYEPPTDDRADWPDAS